MEAFLLIVAIGGIAWLVAKVYRAGLAPPPRSTPERSRRGPSRKASSPTRTHVGRTGAFAPGRRARPERAHLTKQISGRAWVVDGDTIDVDGARIRLFGIDAPEMEHPYGRNAKWAMVKLCKGHRITVHLMAPDVHGRLVGRCVRDDGMDLSAEMVRIGHAIDWPKYSGGIYRHLEAPGLRKRLWRCDARQKGRMPPSA